MSLPLILVDDPSRQAPFDLVRTLKRCSLRLAWLVVPLPETASAGGESPGASSDGDALAAACAATAGSPVALPRYRATGIAAAHRALVEFTAWDSLDTLARLVTPPFVLVVFVSRSTLPFVEAAHTDPRGGALLRLGITGWKLDPDYNMAQKLVSQAKLDYHEHAMTLERTLCQRIEGMVRARGQRGGEASPPDSLAAVEASPAASGPPSAPPSPAPTGRGPVSAST